MTAKDLLSNRLDRMKAGEKSWFWFSDADIKQPLILEPFANPKGMDSLMAQAKNARLPLGSSYVTGIVSVSDQGEFRFASPLIEADMLDQLANWVRKNVKRRPSLARLSGSQALKINSLGTIEERFQNDDIWEGIKRPALIGTLQAASDLLFHLDKGSEAWIWMANNAEGAAPLAIGCATKSDPKAKRFGKLVLGCRARLAKGESGLRGLVRRLGTGGLLITTEDDLNRIEPPLRSWLETFGNLRIVQMKGEDAVAVLRLGSAPADEDFSGIIAALKEIKGGAEYMFWFSRLTRNGRPLLIIEENRAALKGAALEVSVGAPSIRGHIGIAKWGFEFRARKAHDRLLKDLAAWIEANQKAYPKLVKLIDSRVTVRNKAGEVTHRFKDSEAWASLRKPRGK